MNANKAMQKFYFQKQPAWFVRGEDGEALCFKAGTHKGKPKPFKSEEAAKKAAEAVGGEAYCETYQEFLEAKHPELTEKKEETHEDDVPENDSVD